MKLNKVVGVTVALFCFVVSLTTVSLPLSAIAATPQVWTQAPGFYRMKLGDFEVTALLDGTHTFPVEEVMMGTPPASATGKAQRTELSAARPGESTALLAASDLSEPVEGSINAFLINTGKKLILVDSGAGVLYGPCCGHLLENLRTAGYKPEQVDDVFLTHAHIDHLGGIAPNGIIAFPNAVIHVSQLDLDYWLSEQNANAAPAFLKSQFSGAKTSLTPYLAQNRIKAFSGSVELSPGIRSVPSPGHTPGHTFYEIESQGQKLVLWGDIVHVASIQFVDPSVSVKYDYDGDEAQKQREAIFADAASKGYWIGAAHVSFPGLGHVIKTAAGYQWSPTNYTTELKQPKQ